MSNTANIPVPRNPFERESPKEVILIFGCCAAMLIVLVLLRTVINVIIIDICLLGNCGAWKKICCCQLWRAVRRNADDEESDVGDTNSSGFEDNDIEEARVTRNTWRPFRIAGTIVDPVSYVYSSPVAMRDKFLNNIMDEVSVIIPFLTQKILLKN